MTVTKEQFEFLHNLSISQLPSFELELNTQQEVSLNNALFNSKKNQRVEERERFLPVQFDNPGTFNYVVAEISNQSILSHGTLYAENVQNYAYH